MLAEFVSAVDAVRCAVEMQRGMADRNAATPPEQRIEFRVGNSSLMVFKLDHDGREGPPVHVPWVYVDDIVAHYERARERAATVVRELASPWGLPFYVADDPEGNRWTFVQARPTMRS